jgi:DNA-binding transcriptional regulator YiaG
MADLNLVQIAGGCYIQPMPMTPEDVTRVREQLGLTKQQLAKALGMTERAVYYWETGERPITRAIELALEALRCQQRKQQAPRKRSAR